MKLQDFEDIKYTHYIPIGVVRDMKSLDDPSMIYSEKHSGKIKAWIYPEILEKFKDFYKKDGNFNGDNYSIGYISCGDDIIAITLKHINTKYESKDAFMIHCNKLVKFAKEYIKENQLC